MAKRGQWRANINTKKVGTSKPKEKKKKEQPKASKPKVTNNKAKTPSFKPDKNKVQEQYSSFKASKPKTTKPKVTNTSKITKPAPKVKDRKSNLTSINQKRHNERSTAQKKAQIELVKNPVALGVMEEVSWTKNAGDNFGKEAKKIAKQTRKTKTYKGTYAATNVAEYLVPGSAAVKGGKALIKKGVKTSLKKGGKEVTEKAVKEGAKKVSTGKKILAQRVADLGTSAPLNAKEAAKQSYEDGKFDGKKFGKEMAKQTAIDMVVGGGIEGIGAGVTKRQSSKLLKLLKKKENGTATKKELEAISKLNKKLTKKAEDVGDVNSTIASKGKGEARKVADEIKWKEKAAKTKGFTEEQLKKEKSDAYYKRIEELKKEKAQKKADADKYQEGISKGFGKAEDLKKTAEWKKAEQDRLKSGDLAGEVGDKARSKQSGVDNLTRAEERLEKAQAGKKKAGTLEGYQKATNEEARAKADLETARDMNANSTSVKRLQNKIAEIDNEIARATEEKVPTTAERISKLRATKEELSKTLRAEQKKEIERLSKERRLKENGEVSAPKTGSDTITPKAEEKADIMAKTGSNEGRIAEIDKELKAINEERVKPIGKEKLDELNLKAKSLKQEKEDIIKGSETPGKPKESGAKSGGYIPESMKDDEIPFTNKEVVDTETGEITTLKDTEHYLKDQLEAEKFDLQQKMSVANTSAERKGYQARIDEINEKLPDAKDNALNREDIEKDAFVNGRNTINRDEIPEDLRPVFDKAHGEQKKVYKELDDVKASMEATTDTKEFNKLKQKKVELEQKAQKLQAEKKSYRDGRRAGESLEDFIKRENGVEAIDYKISWKHPVEAIRSLGKKYRAFKQFVFTDLAPFEEAYMKLAKQGRKEDARWLRDQVNAVQNADKKCGAIVTGKFSDFFGNEVGKGLDEIFDSVKKDKEKLADFTEYMFHLHNLDRMNPKKFAGAKTKPIWSDCVTVATSEKRIAELEAKFKGNNTLGELETFTKDIRDYLDNLNQYKIDSSLKSEADIKWLDEFYENYVPTYRTDSDGQIVRAMEGTYNVKAGKGAVGGDSKLLPLYDQLITVTNQTVKNAEANRMFNIIAQVNDIPLEKIDSGVTLDDMIDSTILTSRDGGKYKATYFVDGQRMEMEISKEAYHGMKRWSGEEWAWMVNNIYSNNAVKVMRGFKSLITDKNILFAVKNFRKDTKMALLTTKSVSGYIASYPRAIKEMVTDGALYRLYKQNGGKGANLVNVNKELSSHGGRAKYLLTFEWVRGINDVMETIPRFVEFTRTVSEKIGKEADLTKLGKKNLNEALRNSREATTDFGRGSVFSRALSKGVVPFFNPSVQGLSRFTRMFTSDPLLADNVARAYLNLGLKCALPIGAIASVNMALNFDNPNYQALNQRDKDNYLMIPFGDGDTFIKIPHSREGAVINAPIQYLSEIKFGNAKFGWDSMYEMGRNMIDNIGPVNVFTDNLFSPMYRLMTNKTWYGGNILNSQELENIKDGKAKENYDETTSLVGKWIGEKFNVSPKKVDNIMDSYLGIIYDLPIAATADSAKSNPLWTTFFIDSVYSNKRAEKFWDNLDDKDEGKKSQFMAKYGYDASSLNAAIHTIDGDKNLSRDEKLKIKRTLKKELNSIYQAGMDGKEYDGDIIQKISDATGMSYGKAFSKFAYKTHTEAFDLYKNSELYQNATKSERKELRQTFFNTYKDAKLLEKRIGESDAAASKNTIMIYAGLKNGASKELLNSYYRKSGSKMWQLENDIERIKTFQDYNGKAADTRYTNIMKSLVKGAGKITWDKEYNPENNKSVYASNLYDCEIAMICANKKYRDGAYYVSSSYLTEDKMNAARYLDSKNTDWEKVSKFARKQGLNFRADADGNYPAKSSEEVINAIERSKFFGNKNDKIKSAVYHLFLDTDCPYGDFDIVGGDKDLGIWGANKKGHGRGGRRRGHGGGGGGSSSFTPEVYKASGGRSKKLSDVTFDSTLNEAYRKKLKKRIKDMNKSTK